MLRSTRDDSSVEEGHASDSADETDDEDDSKVMKLHKQWKKTASASGWKLDKDSMKSIALIALALLVLLRFSSSSSGAPQPAAVSKPLLRSSNSEDQAEPIGHGKKKKHAKKVDPDEEEDTNDPTANRGQAGAAAAGGYLAQGGGLGLMQTNSYNMPGLMPQQGQGGTQQLQTFMQPGLMQQQGQATQQFLLQQQQQQQQQVMAQAQQQQQVLMQAQAQKQMEEQLQAQQLAFQQQQQQIAQQQQQQQQALMMQLQQQQQPGLGQAQNLLQQQPGLGQMTQFGQIGMLPGQGLTMPGVGGQQMGMLPGIAASSPLQQAGLTDTTTAGMGLAGTSGSGQLAGPLAAAGNPDPVALPQTDVALPQTDRPDDADMTKLADEIPLVELNHFRDSWSPYSAKDIPIYFHIPKAGGSTVKDVVGSCLRMTMASEFGVTDGHDQDTEIAVVYPKVPGSSGSEDRSPFINVDATTVAGIDRAAKMGFADSGLAGCVVTPFLYEANALFTETAQGRLFAVFRHPVDRAVSMFYYIQVADWEPSYKPELQQWTLTQYAESPVIENNWMTRQLANQPSGDLDDSHIRKAMEVVRRKFMVGLMKKLPESMTRFEKFYRWKFHVNPTNQEACRKRLTAGGANSNAKNKKEKPKPGEPLWDLLAAQNLFDIQLYEYIETLFVEQESFVADIPDDFRNIDATCCKCDPPTFPPEGFSCPQKVLNTAA